MEYKVTIPKTNTVEPYEQNKENVAFIYAQDKEGTHITKSCKVKLYMSKSAMLELGKELIRDAYKGGKGDVFHFYHAGKGTGITETLGVILHPQSIEPIIIDDINKSIDKYLQEDDHGL